MKKISLIVCILALCSVNILFAQQTTNYVTKFSATPPNTINSLIFDNGTNVGIGTISPQRILHIQTSQTNGGFRISQTNYGFSSMELFNSTTGGHNYSLVSTGNGNGEGAGCFGIYDYTSPSGYKLFIKNNGNVGIGTQVPSCALDVNGAGHFTSTLDVNGGGRFTSYGGSSYFLAFENTVSPNWKWTYKQNTVGTGGLDMWFSDASTPAQLKFTFQNTGVFEVHGGISVFNNGVIKSRITSEGKIWAQEVLVQVAAPSWPDFVFNKEFKLMSFNELESYISINKHLPNVPSASDIAENGVNLGQMDATLLQKVEELTLYMIELNKKVEALEKENTELKAKVNH